MMTGGGGVDKRLRRTAAAGALAAQGICCRMLIAAPPVQGHRCGGDIEAGKLTRGACRAEKARPGGWRNPAATGAEERRHAYVDQPVEVD